MPDQQLLNTIVLAISANTAHSAHHMMSLFQTRSTSNSVKSTGSRNPTPTFFDRIKELEAQVNIFITRSELKKLLLTSLANNNMKSRFWSEKDNNGSWVAVGRVASALVGSGLGSAVASSLLVAVPAASAVASSI